MARNLHPSFTWLLTTIYPTRRHNFDWNFIAHFNEKRQSLILVASDFWLATGDVHDRDLQVSVKNCYFPFWGIARVEGFIILGYEQPHWHSYILNPHTKLCLCLANYPWGAPIKLGLNYKYSMFSRVLFSMQAYHMCRLPCISYIHTSHFCMLLMLHIHQPITGRFHSEQVLELH